MATKKTAAKRKGGTKRTAKAKAKPAAEGAARDGTKKAKLLAMLTGKGATKEALAKALGWQPHTLRAAISRIGNVEHSRTDGVTTYRLA
jgi:hypothetical protein